MNRAVAVEYWVLPARFDKVYRVRCEMYRRTLCTAFGIHSVNKTINRPSPQPPSNEIYPWKNVWDSFLANGNQVSRSECISHRSKSLFSANISRDLFSSTVCCLDFHTTTIVDPRQLKRVQHMFLLFASCQALHKSNIPPLPPPPAPGGTALFQLGPSVRPCSPSTLERISPPR